MVKSPNTKVLDIGSGVGKFCVLGSLYSNGQFTGVEKRKELIDEANAVKEFVQAENATFIHGNINQVDFTAYEAFYYYNPFYEHVVDFGRIDKLIDFSKEKFEAYEQYVFKELDACPKGTRVVTYCSSDFFLPKEYFLKEMKHNGRLLFWEKK